MNKSTAHFSSSVVHFVFITMVGLGLITFAIGCGKDLANEPIAADESPLIEQEHSCSEHSHNGKGETILADTYANFAALAAGELSTAYSKQWRVTSSATIICTPHGGGIEAGTTEICDSVAGANYDFYSFTGLKTPNSGNATLHITSVNFNEPKGDSMIRAANKALIIHGKSDNDNEIVYIGGRDADLRIKVKNELVAEGFDARIDTTSSISGQAATNFSNRTTIGKGCQLEITTKLRQKLMTNLFNGAANRTSSRTTYFTKFVRALRKAVQ